MSQHSRSQIFNNHRRPLYMGLIIFGAAVVIGLVIASQPSAKVTTDTDKSPLDKSITATRNKLDVNPSNVVLMVALCQDYLQKVRETADSSYYTRCDQLLSEAVAKEPQNASVIAAQALLAYGRHDFTKGLALAQKAQNLDPNHAAYYGLVGDGQIELGQYDQAVAAFQSMVSKRPDLSSFNRVAYIREIYGDISGAENALNNAVASGSSFPENVAYSQVELGKLYSRSDLRQAELMNAQALQTYKQYPPALEGLGKIAFAHRDYTKAAHYFEQAFNALPLAQYANDLADTYAVAGNKTMAAQQYYLAELAFDKSSTGGVNNDFEKATYLTNHSRDLSTANALSQQAVANRPNIFSYDGLAWNWYKQGHYSEAQTTILTALVMGSHEPVILYHAGMIAAKTGQTDQARIYLQQAFADDHDFLESHFSLLDKQAGAKALADLR